MKRCNCCGGPGAKCFFPVRYFPGWEYDMLCEVCRDWFWKVARSRA